MITQGLWLCGAVSAAGGMYVLIRYSHKLPSISAEHLWARILALKRCWLCVDGQEPYHIRGRTAKRSLCTGPELKSCSIQVKLCILCYDVDYHRKSFCVVCQWSALKRGVQWASFPDGLKLVWLLKHLSSLINGCFNAKWVTLHSKCRFDQLTHSLGNTVLYLSDRKADWH